MTWHTIDGGVVPDALAGPLALDFCNTRQAWNATSPPARLVDPQGFVVWAGEHGLDGVAGAAAVPGRALLGRILALRQAVYRCLSGRGTPADWAVVTAEARRARAAADLVVDPTTSIATWVVHTAGPEGALLTVAEQAAALLSSPLAASIAACPGDHCGWLFVDPRGRRRWCSMALCGNRLKARRHAARQRA